MSYIWPVTLKDSTSIISISEGHFQPSSSCTIFRSMFMTLKVSEAAWMSAYTSHSSVLRSLLKNAKYLFRDEVYECVRIVCFFSRGSRKTIFKSKYLAIINHPINHKGAVQTILTGRHSSIKQALEKRPIVNVSLIWTRQRNLKKEPNLIVLFILTAPLFLQYQTSQSYFWQTTLHVQTNHWNADD